MSSFPRGDFLEVEPLFTVLLSSLRSRDAVFRSSPLGPDRTNYFHSVCVQTRLPPLQSGWPAQRRRRKLDPPGIAAPRTPGAASPGEAGGWRALGGRKLQCPRSHLETLIPAKARHLSRKTPAIDGTWLQSHSALSCTLKSGLIL